MRTLLIDDKRNMPTTLTVRTYWDGIKALLEQSWDIVYLDHDLGCFKNGREYTGYNILCWLEQHTERLPGSIVVVSANPAARPRMEMVIRKLYQCRQPSL